MDQLKGTSKAKYLYLLLIFSPVIAVCILISLLYTCTDLNWMNAFILTALGSTIIVLMMPYVFYELAIGYSCSSFFIPVLMVTISKLMGETICFYLGRALSPVLKPILKEFKFFQAIEILTKQKPLKTQLLMRFSGVTPQLILNYGSGVIGTINYLTFFSAANMSGIPSSIFAVYCGKKLQDLRDIFTQNEEQGDAKIIEMSMFGLGMICVGVLIYYIQKEYRRILIVGLEDIDEELNQTVESYDMEMIDAI